MGRRGTELALPLAATVLPPSPAERTKLARRVLRAWLAESRSGSPETRRAKEGDLDAFGRHLGLPTLGTERGRVAVVSRLLFDGFAAAHEAVGGFMAWMSQRTVHAGSGKPRARFAPATRARRLAHLRSLVRVAQRYGLPWGLSVRGPKIRAYRDASGPEAWRVYQVIAALAATAATGAPGRRPKAARDAAILQLLFCLGLRRQSVADLQLADWQGSDLWIRQKGEEQPLRRTLPRATVAALSQWVEHRGTSPGPLFCGVRSDYRGHALAGEEIYRIARRLICNPHGLRHAGATKLAREGHSVFALQAHLGHQSPMTAQHYVDASDDTAGATAAHLAEELGALYDAPHGDRSGTDLSVGE